VGAYDSSRELVIDPVLVYSTYLGGSSSDAGNAIAVDGNGNAYVAGLASSIDFPTVDPIQGAHSPSGSSACAYVTKFNADGSALVYSTYLGGGSLISLADAIAVDSDGNAYVTGYTESADFPTVSAFQGSKPGYGAAFVSKLSPAGDALLYSTYLGGSDAPTKLGGAGAGSTQGYAIAADTGGNAYVTGNTLATNFPLVHPFQGSNGSGFTGFVSKFDAAGSTLVYSTYLGGSGIDIATGIAVDGSGHAIAADAAGNIYVAGTTGSTNFPVFAPFQNANLAGAARGTNVFVTKILLASASTASSGSSGGGGALGWSLIGVLGLELVARRRRRAVLTGGR
jgi:hypothetical protein